MLICSQIKIGGTDMGISERLLAGKIKFAALRMENVKSKTIDDMPTPTGDTISPARAKAIREVYAEEQSIITRMVIAEVSASMTKDAKAIVDANNRLIAKMSKREQVIEEQELQA